MNLRRAVENSSYYITITANITRLKEAKKQIILEAYRTAVTNITQHYEQSEIDTWHLQEAQARACDNDNNASTPFSTTHVIARNITVAALASIIISQLDSINW